MSELFSKFEVNKEPRGPVLGKLLGASVALHFVLAVAVVYIPGVRNAFKLASLIAETRFVDKPYDKTVIGDDVQLIELANNKFHYPEGYFAPENQLAQLPPAVPPPPVIAPSKGPAVQPELTPSPSPLPIASPVVTPPPRSAASPSQAVAQTKASPQVSPSPMSVDEAQAKLEETTKQNNLDLPKENEINKQAMKDFATYANGLRKQGKLDFNKPFEIVIEAELDENGKLKNPKFTKKAGDENLVDLFGHMVAALNDSGFLVYLKPVDRDNPGTTITFTIKQGESEVLAVVESEASSPESARVLAKGFNAALLIGAASRAGKDEEVLLRNTSADSVGKKIVFNFTMPRQAVVDLIKKQLNPDKPS